MKRNRQSESDTKNTKDRQKNKCRVSRKGSGVVFGQAAFPVVDRCPKTTPDPVAYHQTKSDTYCFAGPKPSFAPSRFHAALAEFLAHKAEQLSTALIALEDVLEEQTGADDPERLKRFLYQRWHKDRLGCALLVGDVRASLFRL